MNWVADIDLRLPSINDYPQLPECISNIWDSEIIRILDTNESVISIIAWCKSQAWMDISVQIDQTTKEVSFYCTSLVEGKFCQHACKNKHNQYQECNVIATDGIIFKSENKN